jgi:hypothetical protein
MRPDPRSLGLVTRVVGRLASMRTLVFIGRHLPDLFLSQEIVIALHLRLWDSFRRISTRILSPRLITQPFSSHSHLLLECGVALLRPHLQLYAHASAASCFTCNSILFYATVATARTGKKVPAAQ